MDVHVHKIRYTFCSVEVEHMILQRAYKSRHKNACLAVALLFSVIRYNSDFGVLKLLFKLAHAQLKTGFSKLVVTIINCGHNINHVFYREVARAVEKCFGQCCEII